MAEAGARLVRIPLVPVAVSMVAGIVAGRYLPVPTSAWAVLAGAAIVAAGVMLFRAHLRAAAAAAIAVAVLALSAVHVRIAYFSVPQDHVVTYTGSSRTLATLRGRIVTAPVVEHPLQGQAFTYPRPPQTVFLLEASGVGSGAAARPVRGRVRVSIDEPAWQLRAGQEVELLGLIGRFRKPANPGQFDTEEAARTRGVLVWCSAPMADGATVLPPRGDSWPARAWWRLQAAAAEHFSGGSDEESALLAQALLVGQRHPALRRLNEVMMQAGIAHYLSISGTHLAIFLGFCYLLCRLASLSRRRASAVVLAVLAVYILVAEPNAPLLRSAIMAGALCVSALARRRHSSLNALAAAAVILLAIGPLDLFSAGFQLSFAIVLGLVLLNRPMDRLLWGRLRARQGLRVYREKRRVRRWLAHTLGAWLLGSATMGLSAYTVSVPLAAWHFGLFSPYGMILTTLLALPVAAVLIPGYLSLALVWLMPNASDALAHLAEAAAGGLARFIECLTVLPGLCLEMRPVGVAWVATFYVALALWFLRRRLPWGTAAAILATAAFAGWTVFTQLPAPAPDGMELNLLAVGDGQCAVLRTPAGRTFLVDAGTRSTLDAYPQVLAPFLRERRLPAPRDAFVSHANSDHYNAVAAAVEAGVVRRVYLNEYFGAPGPGGRINPEELRFLHVLDTHGVRVVRLAAGKTIHLDERTRVEVLWPPAGWPPPPDVNDTSLVLRFSCDGRAILLPGDAGAAAQAALARDANRIRADVLLLPHHGSWSEGLSTFVTAVNPRVALVSRASEPHAPGSGRMSSTAAAGDFYARLRTARRYSCTASSGWIQVLLTAPSVTVHTMQDER